MYMPVMIDIKRAVVFGGERGEGLQKTQKLAVFADELLVVPESPFGADHIELPAGQGSELKERLLLKEARSIPVHARTAAQLVAARPHSGGGELDDLIASASWVVSDLLDRRLNESIAAACAQAGVMCTVVDTKDLSNAWFMSLIQTPHLLAGLSTGGTVAFYAGRLREKLQPQFDHFESEAAILAELRSRLPRGQAQAILEQVWADAEFQRRLDPGSETRDVPAARRRAFELAGLSL